MIRVSKTLIRVEIQVWLESINMSSSDSSRPHGVVTESIPDSAMYPPGHRSAELPISHAREAGRLVHITQILQTNWP